MTAAESAGSEPALLGLEPFEVNQEEALMPVDRGIS